MGAPEAGDVKPTREQIEAFRRDIAAVYIKHGLAIAKNPCCSGECWGACHLIVEPLDRNATDAGALELVPASLG